MPQTLVYLPDDTKVSVDYIVFDGRPIVDEAYSDDVIEFIQDQLDEKADELIEEEDDGALEARADERAGR